MHDADISEEIRERILEAHRWGRALRIRAGGTRECPGRRVVGEDLELAAHCGILEWEPSELVLRARAGTPLLALEQTLATRGQMLGFEPPRAAPAATLGGAIATGQSGPRRPFAGAARDFVLGVACIDGTGQRLGFGGRVIKNVAGYDVSRLMCGSHGTLGVVLDVAVKLLPLPECEQSLARECEPLQAMQIMQSLRSKPLPLSGAAWDAGVLRLRLEGAASAVGRAARELGGDLEPDTRWWQDLRDQRLPFFRAARRVWRVSLPATAAPLALDAAELIDWGGAQRWLCGDVDATLVRARAAQLGGHASDCSPGTDSPFQPLAPGMLALQQQVKQVFDPRRVLNPGRLYREL